MVASNPELFSQSIRSVGGKRGKGDVSEFDVGSAGLTPGQRMQKRMKELNQEVMGCWLLLLTRQQCPTVLCCPPLQSVRLLSEADAQRKAIEKYELHFEALRVRQRVTCRSSQCHSLGSLS